MTTSYTYDNAVKSVFPNGKFDQKKYDEITATCGAGLRTYLKCLAFPYLYGATVRTNQSDDRPTMEFLKFGDSRISRLTLEDFEFLRINRELGCVELGCNCEVFRSEPLSTYDEAVLVLNQTWGLLSRFLDLQPIT